MKKYRITFTNDELIKLYMVFHHLTDYMAFDDRLDHGIARIKELRDMSSMNKQEWFALAGKLKRIVRNRK